MEMWGHKTDRCEKKWQLSNTNLQLKSNLTNQPTN